MSGVYVVTGVDTVSGLFVTEACAGFQKASERALIISKLILGNRYDKKIIEKPAQEDTENGPQWFFVSEYDTFVVVSFLNVQGSQPAVTSPNASIQDGYGFSFNFPAIQSTIMGFGDLNQPKASAPLPVPVAPPAPIPATAEEIIKSMGLNVPAGFSISNKPMTNDDLLKYPYQLKSSSELTEAQKWALVSARLRKMSGTYWVKMDAMLELDAKTALSHLEPKTTFATKIRDSVLNDIDLLRDQRGVELYGEVDEDEC